jgi:hypothetical protein
MKKIEAIKATLIAALLISMTLTILAIPGTSAYIYPDMEYKYENAGDILHGVLVGAMGWYAYNEPGIYYASQHYVSRFAIWPDQYTGEMSYRIQETNRYSSGSIPGEEILTSVRYDDTYYVYSYCTSHFTNAVLGGDWIQGKATSIWAS